MSIKKFNFHLEVLPLLLTAEDGPGVEEVDSREEQPVGEVRQEDAERLLAGTAALTAGWSTPSPRCF